jgi:hypothetical protein
VGVDDAPAVTDELTVPPTDPLASDLVGACEAAWRSIQAHHPELPPVVMLLGTGVERGRLVKLGHWWEGRWLADGDLRGEVLLAGEALHLKPQDVFEVLLHEAAHGINAARHVKDTSRGGRYHNARFKRTAIEVGLTVEQMHPYGFARTAVPPATAQRYAAEIDRLGTAMRIARRVPRSALATGKVDQKLGGEQGGGEQGGGVAGGESPRTKVPPAECGCGRRLRMAPSVLARGPVICGVCGSEFVVDLQVDRSRILEARTVPTADGTAARPPVDTDPEVVRAERLLSDAGRAPGGLDMVVRLGTWRGTLGTEAERPMTVAAGEDVGRWEQLARAVLTVDGSLRGPGCELHDGLEVRAGDRVVVGQSTVAEGSDTLPGRGTPGVVTVVHPAEREAVVDFAASGVFSIRAGSGEALALRYGYCELDPTGCDLATLSPRGERPLEPDAGIEL